MGLMNGAVGKQGTQVAMNLVEAAIRARKAMQDTA